MKLISILLDTISRPRCIECDVPMQAGYEPFCPQCDRRLPRWRNVDGCPRCATRLPLADGHEIAAPSKLAEGCPGCFASGSPLHVCRALVRYEGAVRRWIPGFKRTGNPLGPPIETRLAIQHLATELARRAGRETRVRPDLIVSIPLHPRRRRARGFNHADVIADRVAKVLDRPCIPTALERFRDTRPQAEMAGRERFANVQGAFRATDALGSAATVWLVDDVLTTGSTLEAAGNALLEAGVEEVRALTLAATSPAPWAAHVRSAYHAAPSIDRSQPSD